MAFLPEDPKFYSTQWTIVALAAEGSREAIGMLYKTYWYPLYAYLRRRGDSIEDSEDLVQQFFYQLIDSQGFQKLSKERGRLRSFLLTALRNFRANEWRRDHAAKRPGSHFHISTDIENGERRFANEPALAVSNQEVYDRDWAITVLESAYKKLTKQYATTELKRKRFKHLQSFLVDYTRQIPLAEIAEQLDMERGAVRTEIFRLRKLHKEILRREVAQTLIDPTEEEIDQELGYLLRAAVGAM